MPRRARAAGRRALKLYQSQCAMYISRDAACRVRVNVQIFRRLDTANADAAGRVPTDSDLLIQRRRAAVFWGAFDQIWLFGIFLLTLRRFSGFGSMP